MKKTLLATAIAGAMGLSAAAQAATVYDQDGTQVDLYGRLAYGITTGGVQEDEGAKTNGSEFVDLGSRFGFRANHQLSSDLGVFARLELRGRADAQNDDGFDTIRNSYVGLNSNQFGSLTVGNFDSVFYQVVSSVFDVPENAGWTAVDGGSVGARGDSLQYSTPNLEGFQAHVAVKHLSGNGATVGAQDNSSSSTWHAGASYEIGGLYLGAAYNQSKQLDGDRGYSYDAGNPKPISEDLWGVVASYAFTPAFSTRLTYQEVGDVTASQADIEAAMPLEAFDGIDNLWGIGATFDYGMGEVYGDYYRVRMIDDRFDTQNRWVLGANYRFSQPMYVFAELYQEDSSTSVDDSVRDNFRAIDDNLLYTVGVRYDF